MPFLMDAVEIYRCDCFQQLGFGQLAMVMACEPRLDLSFVRSMVEAGCPPHLALKIAWPDPDSPPTGDDTTPDYA